MVVLLNLCTASVGGSAIMKVVLLEVDDVFVHELRSEEDLEYRSRMILSF